jgi:hypothetical protein
MRLIAFVLAWLIAAPAFSQVVQRARNYCASTTTCTATFSGAVTSGNTIIALAYGNGVSVTSVAHDGNTMTEDLDANFTQISGTRRNATSTGTGVVLTAPSANLTICAWEVSPVSGIDATVGGNTPTDSGEGSATTHSFDFTNAGTNRVGFAMGFAPTNRTWTGTGGTTAEEANNSAPWREACVDEAGLGTGAQTLDFTVDLANTINFFGFTYAQTVAGGAVVPASQYYRRRRN